MLYAYSLKITCKERKLEMESKKQILLERLNRNRYEYAFIIRAIEMNTADRIYEHKDSIAVFQERSGFHLFALQTSEDFAPLAEMLEENPKTIYVNNINYLSAVKQIFPAIAVQEYIKTVIERKYFNPASYTQNKEVEIVKIDESWTDFILTLYKSREFGNKEYINRCIRFNPALGAIYKGEMVGYCLEHLDGEIGSLAISEKARELGIGTTLMCAIIPEYLKTVDIGCGFVLPDNICSQKMLKKSCFRFIEPHVFWGYI